MQGTVLADRYRLGEVLGRGGMGTVYRATDLHTGGTVAVKVVHPHLAHDPVYNARLRREGQALITLTSPRVVRLVDVDALPDGGPFLVMEYVPGETLADRLRRDRVVPLAEALAVALEVARALEAAHACGIVHRDLTPANIKLVDGQVKVLDFGLAQIEGNAGLTVGSGFVGTPAYTAPERADGRGDIRSDIYSLGVVLYEILAGRRPFMAPSPLAMLRQHEVAPLPSLPKAVPRVVRVVVVRALAKRPADRYQDPTTMVRALLDARDRIGSAVADQSPSRSRRQSSPVARTISGGPTVTVSLGQASSGAEHSPDGDDRRSGPVTRFRQAGARPTSTRTRRTRRSLLGAGAVVVTLVIGAGTVVRSLESRDVPTETASVPPATAGAGPLGESQATTEPSPTVMKSTETPPIAATPSATPAVPVVETYAGTGESGFKDGTALQARFYRPEDIAMDQRGNLYVADELNHSIRQIHADGTVTTLAGARDGDWGSLDGANEKAQFRNPSGIAVDGRGYVYVADWGNNSVRKIDPVGMTVTIAGDLEPGYVDDVGTAARFRELNGIAVDAGGVIYVADTGNHAIRKITPDGRVSTLAGSGVAGFADGFGRAARFAYPYGVVVDAMGTVYVADAGNHRIRSVRADGTVTTVAGSGTAGFADGASATARFAQPYGLALTGNGTLYVADEENNRIRRVASDGTVSTVAGTGALGFRDGATSEAVFNRPHSLALDSSGNLYVADVFNHRIRKITLAGAE
jgi:serine/threonine protein kinase/sugar lactone lactonase YvrE